jgi:hypothetical protein
MATVTGEQVDERVVGRPMNEHGSMTLRGGAGRDFHVVEYADETVRQRLSDLSSGEYVRVRLSRTHGRGCAWRATAAYPAPAAEIAAD